MGALKDKLQIWSSERLASNVLDALRRLARAEDVVRVAAMPDVHLAHEVCVGVAVATHNTLYPSAVGGDIGCGMDAVRLKNLKLDQIDEVTAKEILKGLSSKIPIRQHEGARALPSGLNGRTAAARRISVESLKEQMLGVWYDDRLAHRLRDEAPGAYKDIRHVMRAQRDLTRIVRRLRPLLVYKGG